MTNPMSSVWVNSRMIWICGFADLLIYSPSQYGKLNPKTLKSAVGPEKKFGGRFAPSKFAQ